MAPLQQRLFVDESPAERTGIHKQLVTAMLGVPKWEMSGTKHGLRCLKDFGWFPAYLHGIGTLHGLDLARHSQSRGASGP
jgi:hypothetical protein